MTHTDAAATHAVERYLLGELTPEERDDFEAHAFDCLECADDLKAAALFLDSTRSVFREDHARSGATAAGASRAPAASTAPAAPRVPTPAPKPGWRNWLRPALPVYAFASAFMLLLGFSLYQNLVTLPSLRNSSTPRALSSFSFVSSGTRGATPMVLVAPPGQPFLLFFDIPPVGSYTSFHCAIVGEDGTPQLAVDVSAAQARDTVQLFVPASRLTLGPHTLVITGEASRTGAQQQREIARYPFVLQGRE